MKPQPESLKKFATRTFAAAAALGLAAQAASALDLSGVITVNGVESEGVILIAYDCDSLALLGITNTGPTEVTDGVTHNYSFSVASEHVRLDLFFQDDPTDMTLADYCRAYVLCEQIIPVDGKATVNYDMTCVLDGGDHGPGSASLGFWKNHPGAWPVDAIDIGGHTYTKAEAIRLLKRPTRGDKTRTLFAQLVSAKLNVIAGNDDSCIAAEIAQADAWMALHPVGSGVRGSSAAWHEIAPIADKLDDYNNGLLCAPYRE